MWDWSGTNTAIASPSSALQIIRQCVANGLLTKGTAVAIIGNAVLSSIGVPTGRRPWHQRILRQIGVIGDLSDPVQMLSKSTGRILRTVYSTGHVTARWYP